ncbi:unnamed protein product [Lactuca saligna]|uniref:Uncharacterized protein n=1 Tax=Lactuca saligna TaxID=75948 RepID=A0AA35VK55_LACSI|nr:unnamed protein product [Lactuca saligna]
MQNPFLNLITSPPPPPFAPPTSQMTTSPITSIIPITIIPPLPSTSFIKTSLPQVLISLSSPIFMDSTIPKTSTVSTPPEVPRIKSVLEEICTSGIPRNTSDVGPNATIGVTSKQPSSSVPLEHNDANILFGDDPESIVNFVFHPLSVNLTSDDDVAAMKKALKVGLPVQTEDFLNIQFKGFRVNDQVLHPRNCENGCRDCFHSEEEANSESIRTTERHPTFEDMDHSKEELEHCLEKEGDVIHNNMFILRDNQ